MKRSQVRLADAPARTARVKPHRGDLTLHACPIDRGQRIAGDYYQQVLLKHPGVSEFLGRAGYLYALLLEAESSVTSYIPRPFRLTLGKRHFVPDNYVVFDTRRPTVIKLVKEPIPAAQRELIVDFLCLQRLDFEEIAIESVLARKTEALNWAEIVRVLYQARDLDTLPEEQGLWARMVTDGPCTLGDLIDPGDRARTYAIEVALFRLLHRGVLRAALCEHPLDYDTPLEKAP